jgi:hypothetical protein
MMEQLTFTYNADVDIFESDEPEMRVMIRGEDLAEMHEERARYFSDMTKNYDYLIKFRQIVEEMLANSTKNEREDGDRVYAGESIAYQNILNQIDGMNK